MNLKRLRDEFNDTASVVESLGAAGNKAAADEIRAIGAILEGPDDLSADQALQALENLLARERRELRDTYGERLTRAGTDKTGFEQVHAELATDKKS